MFGGLGTEFTNQMTHTTNTDMVIIKKIHLPKELRGGGFVIYTGFYLI